MDKVLTDREIEFSQTSKLSSGMNGSSRKMTKEVELKTLDYLCKGWTQGIKQLESNLDSYRHFYELSECLLTGLAERTDNSYVDIKAAEFDIQLQDDSDFIIIKINETSSIIFDHSIRTLLQDFIADILSNPEYYPEPCVNYALNYALIDGQGIDFVVLQCATQYVITHPVYQTSNSIKAAAAKQIFRLNLDPSLKNAEKIAEMLVYSSGNCQLQSTINAAQHILTHRSSYPRVSIISASVIVTLHANNYSNEIFKIAAADVAKNSADYPRGFATQAASKFIKKNLSCFKAHRDRNGLLAVFENRRNILTDYSDQLTNILESKKTRITVEINESNQASKRPNLKKISMIEAWTLCLFDAVLEKDEDNDITNFILNNMNHEALTFWIASTVNEPPIATQTISLGENALNALCRFMIEACPRMGDALPIYLIEDILCGLLNMGDLTEFHVRSANLKFRQIDERSIEISTVGMKIPGKTLPNTSFRKIQENLVSNFILENKNGTLRPEMINFVLTHTMTFLENNPKEFFHKTAYYQGIIAFILGSAKNSIGNQINEHLRFAAARNVFKYTQHYSISYASTVAEATLCHVKNRHGTNAAEGARYIIEQSEHRPEWMSSAAVYIALNAFKFPLKIFTLAANYIVENSDAYSDKFISEMALNFTKQHAGFFKGELNYKQKFIQFYEENKGMDLLESYKSKLKAALELDDRLVPVTITKAIDYSIEIRDPEKTVITLPNQGSWLTCGDTELTVEELWRFGHFKSALQNKNMSIFILRNTSHPAIVFFNNPTQTL